MQLNIKPHSPACIPNGFIGILNPIQLPIIINRAIKVPKYKPERIDFEVIDLICIPKNIAGAI